jgi:hypothetical protein
VRRLAVVLVPPDAASRDAQQSTIVINLNLLLFR